MAWAYLFTAALFEIGWAIGLKYTQGFTKLWPSVLTVAAMAVSLTFLAMAVRTIPVGTGYAIWTGIGAVGTATLGVILFAEPLTAWRVVCLLLIVGGVVGLKFAAS
jgi:quaternary ammonium compound-resistance protein SugE